MTQVLQQRGAPQALKKAWSRSRSVGRQQQPQLQSQLGWHVCTQQVGWHVWTQQGVQDVWQQLLVLQQRGAPQAFMNAWSRSRSVGRQQQPLSQQLAPQLAPQLEPVATTGAAAGAGAGAVAGAGIGSAPASQAVDISKKAAFTI
ncbi:MAG: hypothetical protein NZ700_08935 [Gemmataceae bacterium]|nr:hypothetical protein [Gemmataceae bacterium]MDW8267396.1 hypothetical protein [Gemmataceae bacterium]